MHKTKTFRTKLWLCFVLFAGVIFGLLWLMQAVFLQTFYNGMLEKNTRQAARKIVSAAGSAELTDLIDTLSNENSCLYLSRKRMGRSCTALIPISRTTMPLRPGKVMRRIHTDRDRQ